MNANGLKFLVIEGYKKAERENLKSREMTVASELYKDMLSKVYPESVSDIFYAADPDGALPQGASLCSYDGIAMTGSSLCVMDTHDNSVQDQIELQKEIFRSGVPSFGSCWAIQVGTVAAGGSVRQNPKGREMGFARKIRLTEEGLNHPLYEGKAPVFDAFASHEDEIETLAPDSKVLATNRHSKIQSLEIRSEGGVMWALQYHPEYNTAQMAALVRLRTPRLIGMGFFKDETVAEQYARKLEDVYNEPERKDLKWELGIDEDILDRDYRVKEVRNWIEHLVIPGKKS